MFNIGSRLCRCLTVFKGYMGLECEEWSLESVYIFCLVCLQLESQEEKKINTLPYRIFLDEHEDVFHFRISTGYC
ncbi:hypothetical protein MKW98_025279 [Papaver atlanticum]|uniref:Uncharacterized protein n=1 Tax=Papaver atlanticum TaxID=357466 RepID=A0AAD4X6E8_9MAGN|nr:hypothetical protein MKW98_025279 [Papaver atlanticum]